MTTDRAEALPRSRPGLTSLVRTARGLMTVQTELVGEPGELTTIVDFRGRVLKRWTRPFTPDPDADDAGSAAAIRSWHGEIEARVRENLARAARRRCRPIPIDEAVSRLFLAGVEAQIRRDFATAEVALRACVELLPDDPRVRAALRRLDERGPARARRPAATE